jgi:inorganic phosphate transporter, PiT family
MLVYFSPSSPASITALIFCFGLVLAFEATNGFHDSANVVATVIYTNSLRPAIALVWSGIMNFFGVLFGGIALAFALVELLPPFAGGIDADTMSSAGGRNFEMM